MELSRAEINARVRERLNNLDLSQIDVSFKGLTKDMTQADVRALSYLYKNREFSADEPNLIIEEIQKDLDKDKWKREFFLRDYFQVETLLSSWGSMDKGDAIVNKMHQVDDLINYHTGKIQRTNNMYDILRKNMTKAARIAKHGENDTYGELNMFTDILVSISRAQIAGMYFSIAYAALFEKLPTKSFGTMTIFDFMPEMNDDIELVLQVIRMFAISVASVPGWTKEQIKHFRRADPIPEGSPIGVSRRYAVMKDGDEIMFRRTKNTSESPVPTKITKLSYYPYGKDVYEHGQNGITIEHKESTINNDLYKNYRTAILLLRTSFEQLKLRIFQTFSYDGIENFLFKFFTMRNWLWIDFQRGKVEDKSRICAKMYTGAFNVDQMERNIREYVVIPVDEEILNEARDALLSFVLKETDISSVLNIIEEDDEKHYKFDISTLNGIGLTPRMSDRYDSKKGIIHFTEMNVNTELTRELETAKSALLEAQKDETNQDEIKRNIEYVSKLTQKLKEQKDMMQFKKLYTDVYRVNLPIQLGMRIKFNEYATEAGATTGPTKQALTYIANSLPQLFSFYREDKIDTSTLYPAWVGETEKPLFQTFVVHSLLTNLYSTTMAIRWDFPLQFFIPYMYPEDYHDGVNGEIVTRIRQIVLHSVGLTPKEQKEEYERIRGGFELTKEEYQNYLTKTSLWLFADKVEGGKDIEKAMQSKVMRDIYFTPGDPSDDYTIPDIYMVDYVRTKEEEWDTKDMFNPTFFRSFFVDTATSVEKISAYDRSYRDSKDSKYPGVMISYDKICIIYLVLWNSLRQTLGESLDREKWISNIRWYIPSGMEYLKTYMIDLIQHKSDGLSESTRNGIAALGGFEKFTHMLHFAWIASLSNAPQYDFRVERGSSMIAVTACHNFMSYPAPEDETSPVPYDDFVNQMIGLVAVGQSEFGR